MKRTLKLRSPAKVNLRLEILRKRPDGYHEIRTLFQQISLHDTIHFSLCKEQGISITTNAPRLPVGKENLVYKAAHAILKQSNHPGGVSIHIAKRIPLGAGLGGGSSNAAATLKALNDLLELGLTQEEMMAMGVKIGADVPFFFLKKGALATGIGERLKEIDLPGIWYVLVYPNFEVSTAWAYQNTRLTKGKFRYKIHKFLTTPEAVSRILMNDLERVVSGMFPQICLMKEILRSHGALGSLMSGSGPTVYGIFAGERTATRACKDIRREVEEKGWLVIKAHSLP
jgi:4-diphosphocytidyl-2-C-methyl-D-erythritol kinase